MNLANKPSLRVLHVISSLGMGGVETWIMSLIKLSRSLSNELKYDVQFDICLTSGQKSVFDDDAKSYGVKLHYIEFSRSNFNGFTRAFRSMLVKGNYHAIHDHQDCLAGLHLLIGIGCLPPVKIVHVHSPLIHIESYASGWLRKSTIIFAKLAVALLASHVFGTSSQALTEYGFDGPIYRHKKPRALHCGFDIKRFSGTYEKRHKTICSEFMFPASAKVLLFVGRLEANKNHKNPGFALEVLKESVKQDPSIRLLMVGENSSCKKKWEGIAQSFGIADKVLFLGIRHDVPELMQGSDLFLFPSVGEGLGMVAVEAQAAALRVLASDAVPNECAVIPGMVKFKSLQDGPESWAAEVVSLMNMKRPDSLSSNKAVEDSPFSISTSLEDLINVYSSEIMIEDDTQASEVEW